MTQKISHVEKLMDENLDLKIEMLSLKIDLFNIKFRINKVVKNYVKNTIKHWKELTAC